MLATAYLKKPAKHPTGPAVAVFGDERFLKHRVIQAIKKEVVGDEGDEELSLIRLAGKTATLSGVLDDLRTPSMWGERRLVWIEEADPFVTEHRAALEKYLNNPGKKAVLLLDVKSWVSSTRLAKKVVEIGLEVECKPLSQRGQELSKWLTEHCETEYGKQLPRDAGLLLIELAGTELGLLDQQLAKLSSFVGAQPVISAEAVTALVGGWKAETTWSMIDAVRDGQPSRALQLLDKLLTANEAPLKLLAGIAVNMKPLARATELARAGRPLRQALEEAGVKPFVIESQSNYLRRLGRPHAEQLLRWLLAAESDLKGASPLSERILMERLLLRLCGPRK